MEMNTMQDQGFAMPTVEEPQHSQRTPLAEPQLSPRASSGRAWSLWLTRPPQGGRRPLGAQPPPQVLELAASKVAHLTTLDPSGAGGGGRDAGGYHDAHRARQGHGAP